MNEEKILQPEQNYGPGNVLRAKREEYEWSVDAVAEALHLSTAAVKSIEADRYEDLPGATYVMGYWRSYARLLGIDIEETIEANKRNLNVVTAEASGMDVIRPVLKKKGGRKGIGWLFFLIVLGALGYYAWQQNFFGLLEKFQNMQEGSTEQLKPVAEVQPEPEPKDQVLRPLKTPVKTVDSKEADANQGLLASPSVGLNGQAVAPASDSVSVSTDSGAMAESKRTEPLTTPAGQTMGQTGLVLSQSAAPASPATSVAEPVIATAPVSVVTDSTENSIQDQAQAAAPATAESNQSDTTSSQATPAGDSELVLTVTKKNWIDVRDKTSKRLEFRAGSAGDVIKVKGIAPFYVYIAPPDSVEVRYNGKAFSLPEKNNGISIRFKLDKTLQPL